MLRDRTKIFMQECMTLLTYMNMMYHDGHIIGDNFICSWEAYNRVYLQLKRAQEAYQATFVAPAFSPDDPEHPEASNDNQE